MKQKIGLFFGSFDPIHKGHLELVQDNYFNKLNQIWFVITPESPFKKDNIIASFHHRVQMVRIAIAGFEKFKLCDIEYKLSAPYYTADTLRVLLEKHPNCSFEIIMGSDNYLSLSNQEWHNSTYILNNFKLIVYPRHETLVKSNNLLKILNGDLLPFSSSNIRSSLQSHLDSVEKSHLNHGVINYIIDHNLYNMESN